MNPVSIRSRPHHHLPLRRRLGARAAAALAGSALVVAGMGGASPVHAAADSGQVTAFGAAADHGEPGDGTRSAIAGLTSTPSGDGYWVVSEGGGVFSFGDARFLGSMGGSHLNQPVVDIAATPTGEGYWLATADGGIFSFGDARFLGSMGGTPLNQPVVGITATRSGKGYWMVAADGGIFTFGDARFLGSMGGTPLNSPIVGISTTPKGDGYVMVAADGGVFTFGDARFQGSLGDRQLASPVVGLAGTPSGEGYWMATGDGAVHAFGDAAFHGSATGDRSSPVAGVSARPDGSGYWLVTGRPAPVAEQSFETAGYPPDSDFDRLAQCESGGNWAANTGNGYYGGLQFSLSSWRAVGGPGYPHQQSRETQIEMGRRLWAEQGWGAWPHCSRQAGLR